MRWGLGEALHSRPYVSPPPSAHPLPAPPTSLRDSLAHMFPASSPPPTGPGLQLSRATLLTSLHVTAFPPPSSQRNDPPTHKLHPSICPQLLPSQKAPCVAGSTQPLSRTSYPRAPLQQGCPGPHLDTQLGTGQTQGTVIPLSTGKTDEPPEVMCLYQNQLWWKNTQDARRHWPQMSFMGLFYTHLAAHKVSPKPMFRCRPPI